MGALDHLSDMCSATETKHALKIRKRRPLQTVDIRVKMDCDGCERRVKHALTSMRGVINVNVNRKQSRVTVTGHVEPNKLTTRSAVRFVRNVPQAMVSPSAPELTYMTLFSDENTNACSIM
uniref:HMA domain-containing protein n=1 Tax=Ananas comosus var. bracteatus TaxID=296719 RepID=A0A6V7NXU9_ANACO|nr:unnamed protein product [Ananas comosus var. bracteatus]